MGILNALFNGSGGFGNRLMQGLAHQGGILQKFGAVDNPMAGQAHQIPLSQLLMPPAHMLEIPQQAGNANNFVNGIQQWIQLQNQATGARPGTTGQGPGGMI